ncbi:MAG: hypothetical protein IT320_00470 [Anaerolineae bacterium]|nr:hypothetical protein [Anaerolineae bacterium]
MKEFIALDRRPMAVVAVSDKTAMGALEAISEQPGRLTHRFGWLSRTSTNSVAVIREYIGSRLPEGQGYDERPQCL